MFDIVCLKSEKCELTDLTDKNVKLKLDMDLILSSYWDLTVQLEVIASILPFLHRIHVWKSEADAFTGPRPEFDVWYEFECKLIAETIFWVYRLSKWLFC